jgi:type I restriction enzyme R subunit
VPHQYSEDSLVEQPAIELFKELGWEAANCYHETFGTNGFLGRETAAEVVLTSRLRPALKKLNPDLPPEAIESAIEQLTRDRSAMSAVQANRDIYYLIKNGVRLDLSGLAKRKKDEDSMARVKVIDWENSQENDFFLASQFWMTDELGRRRADLIGFVNGLPLLFIELKRLRIEDAFQNNLRDYKTAIPKLFWYNSFILLSNGSKARIGSITGEWDHFSEWKKINDEGEEGIVSLETMIHGTCEPAKLLDLVENFSLFSETTHGHIKLIAKNHQYLGVGSALKAVDQIRKNQGKLGVFWHTQGSGKSFSMVFFSQKILRKVPGNWTFVVITDREDLDDQIYKNFAGVGAVTEPEKHVRAKSGKHLKQLLQEDHRYVFTLIQKFRNEKGKRYPVISKRDDIIVITDEAHRSQYDQLALNMRNALPNAAFIAFTGTPLIAGEERTKEVFGDYISIYNFQQSVEDNATVPLYYENRIPELQLKNDKLNEDMARVIEDAELNENQEAALEREFRHEYHLITRNERLERVAEDIVKHFMGRGFRGKAMVVSLDKATAVRMHDKVQKYWPKHLKKVRSKLATCAPQEREELEKTIGFLSTADMAVVVSQAQNEVEDLKKKGADIKPHRKRMVNEDLETKFKDADDPLRIVFVCAMWMTGFDVPSCSTIYLDKPMRNHTLMQTIARANRVFGEKVNGLIVDYVGVFRSLQKALAIYGASSGGGVKSGQTPANAKKELVTRLRVAIREATEFCDAVGVELNKIPKASGFKRVALIDEAVDVIVRTDETKNRFRLLERNVSRLYKAILPDSKANEFYPVRALLQIVADKIQDLVEPPDISGVMSDVDALLDESIASEGYIIHNTNRLLDLSKIDVKKLRKYFAKSRKHTEVERLKNAVAAKIANMVALNRSRMDYLEHFQEMIDEYNSGAVNVDVMFDRILAFMNSLDEEERRTIREDLSEEELAIFDLLTKPKLKLTKKDTNRVKRVVRELLDRLKREKLVLEWRARQQSKADVRITIEEGLDELPEAYSQPVWNTKCDLIYQHIFDSYFGGGQSIYAQAA